jgi:hypothetical protein
MTRQSQQNGQAPPQASAKRNNSPRVDALQREVVSALQRDQILVDRLVQVMEESIRSERSPTSEKDAGGEAGASDAALGGTQANSEMKTLLQQFLKQQEKGNSKSGSHLLGELKQVMDLESHVARRCWELMGEDWFEDLLCNT